jgi:hypothetical protein
MEGAMNKSLADDPLVSQSRAKGQLGDPSDMTIWRWRRKGILPEPIVINCRNYWRQSQLDAVLASVAPKDREVA